VISITHNERTVRLLYTQTQRNYFLINNRLARTAIVQRRVDRMNSIQQLSEFKFPVSRSCTYLSFTFKRILTS